MLHTLPVPQLRPPVEPTVPLLSATLALGIPEGYADLPVTLGTTKGWRANPLPEGNLELCVGCRCLDLEGWLMA